MAGRSRASRRISQDSVNATGAPSRNFNIYIQNFDGNPSLIEFFFSQLEDFVKFNAYTDEQALSFLKSKLVGNALEFYLSSQELKGANNINEAKQILTEFFSSSNVRVSAAELNNIKLLQGESVKNLVHRINAVALKVYPNMDATALNQIKLVQLIAALPSEMQCKIYEKGVNGYKETVELAQRIQDSQIASSSNYDITENTELNKLKQQINLMQADYGKCQLCDASGHTAKNCEKFSQLQSKNNCVRVQCQFCSKTGHILRDCFKFKRSKNYTTSQFEGRNDYRGNFANNNRNYNRFSNRRNHPYAGQNNNRGYNKKFNVQDNQGN